MAPEPPWSVRKDSASWEEFYLLREGVPEGLSNSLVGFLHCHFVDRRQRVRTDRSEHLARRVGRDLPRYEKSLLEVFEEDHVLLLDAVDHVLMYPLPDVQTNRGAAAEIKQYLDDARSVYDVVGRGDGTSELQYRQPPELTALLDEVVTSRSRASEHLRSARSLAFGRDANPTAACIEATKAVEAAARDVIIPTDSTATMGKMIVALEDKPAKWQTDFEPTDHHDIRTVSSLMQLIWKGHPRHGNPDDPLSVPPQRAEMIVHVAALLVHWFVSGRVRSV